MSDFEGVTYLLANSKTGEMIEPIRGYAISHVWSLHKKPHLWRIDGVTWNSVASFKSREEAEAFRDWLNTFGRFIEGDDNAAT